MYSIRFFVFLFNPLVGVCCLFFAGAHLREKTQTYLKMKADLAAIRAESVVLRRTEQILKSRDEVLSLHE